MTATNHTEHYDLSQYTEDDRPTYTGDYNSDMNKIDEAIYAASQSGGMLTVEHTADLTGDGTADSPLGVADTIAKTEDIPSLDEYATTESVTQAIASAIADRLTAGDIQAGSGINIETSGNQVTISYVGDGSSGGLTAIAHDNTLTGDGTTEMPLGVVAGTAIKPVDNSWDTIDFNDFYTSGIYTFNCQAINGPMTIWTSGAFMVFRGFQAVMQVYFSSPFSPVKSQMAVRYAIVPDIYTAPVAENWSAWKNIATMDDIPDVSALTSRITALESTVSQLTAAALPASPGLTAEALDTQYSDDYNIIRTATAFDGKG